MLRDPHGYDLPHMIEMNWELAEVKSFLSTEKVGMPAILADVYNAADFTRLTSRMPKDLVLATLESLACGTPIIVNMTGGLQEQVTNGKLIGSAKGIQPNSSSMYYWFIYKSHIFMKTEFRKEDFYNAIPQMGFK